MEDTKIIDLFLARNEDALLHTANKYGSRLRNLANQIVRDFQEAEECENDTYMEAWNSIPPHEPRQYFFAFLARITRHIALDVCRKRNRLKRSTALTELTDEIEQCIPSPNDTECKIEAIVLGEIISNFLRKQKPERRNIFLHRYWYMDSVTEIANRFGISESKVKTTLFRCRNELREYLIKEGYSL